MNNTVTYVPIEFVGGPRDGERIMWIYPPPPVIVFPISGESVLRLGEYRPQDGVEAGQHEQFSVACEEISKSEGVVLDVLLAKATNPFEYDWCGEG